MNDVVLNVKYKKQFWKIALKNKITNIVGDSATGKSTLAIACSEESSDIARVNVIGAKKKYSVITSYDIPRYISAVELIENRDNTVFIIDEDHIKRFKSDEVAKAIVKSSNYFIYIGRVKLSNMNIDLDSVGYLREYNGILQLFPIEPSKISISKRDCIITDCVLEDEGSAYTWFQRLFEKCGFTLHSSKNKERVCETAEKILTSDRDARVLLVFDRISFGSCSKDYINLINKFGNRLYVNVRYKSWEHLMLNTNMFRMYFKSYNLECGMFEEEFYEKQLHEISKMTGHPINHDTGKGIAYCYTDKCCKYSNRDCSVGLKSGAEHDKFVDLLRGTEFEAFAILSKRIDT